MQHDLIRSGHGLYLWLSFSSDLLRSNYSEFSAYRQDKHDAGKQDFVIFLSQKLSNLRSDLCPDLKK